MRQINFNRTHINEISQHIDNLFTDQQATMISSKTLKHIRKKDDATNQNTSVVLEAVLFKMHGLYMTRFQLILPVDSHDVTQI